MDLEQEGRPSVHAATDLEGYDHCGGAGGLWIMDPHGRKLGRIVHGAPATTNLAFGGDDWKTLYFTSRNHLGAVNVKIRALLEGDGFEPSRYRGRRPRRPV